MKWCALVIRSSRGRSKDGLMAMLQAIAVR